MHRRRAKLGATFREFISQLGETRADGTARHVSDYLFATIHRGAVEILDPEHTCEEATLDIGHRIACFLREEAAETRAEEEEKEEMTVAVSSPASRSSTTKSERWAGPPWLIVLPAHVTLALNEDVEMGGVIGGGAVVPYGGVPYASLASMFRAPSSAAERRASAQKKTADARERVWQKELTKARKEKEKRAKAKEEKLRKEREKEKRRAEQQRRKAAREAEREKRREKEATETRGTADDTVTALIAQRVRERLLAKVSTGGGGDDEAAGARLIGACVAPAARLSLIHI